MCVNICSAVADAQFTKLCGGDSRIEAASPQEFELKSPHITSSHSFSDDEDDDASSHSLPALVSASTIRLVSIACLISFTVGSAYPGNDRWVLAINTCRPSSPAYEQRSLQCMICAIRCGPVKIFSERSSSNFPFLQTRQHMPSSLIVPISAPGRRSATRSKASPNAKSNTAVNFSSNHHS
jgi:hypothetical protein